MKLPISFALSRGGGYVQGSIVAFATNMIVCSCNVFTDHDVRGAIDGAEQPLRTTGQVYGCLGCSPKCGRCAASIRKIMDEALGAIRACPSNCGCAAHPADPPASAGAEA